MVSGVDDVFVFVYVVLMFGEVLFGVYWLIVLIVCMCEYGLLWFVLCVVVV